MSPPRRPQGPRSPSSHDGRGSGQPSRPRAFDGKRGWKVGDSPAQDGPRAGRPGFKPAGKPTAPPERGSRRPEQGVPPSRPRADSPRREEDRAPANTLWLHGLHAVAAALLNPRRRLRRLLVTADAEAALKERLPEGTFAARKIQPERVEDRARFHTFLPEDSVHQGAALLAEPLPQLSLDDALRASDGPVLLLDQVTDPRNVGAILRSAAAFGAAAVVVQDRHAPPETGALARAASGALEIVPMVREVNLSRAIRHLQDGGAWVMGLTGDGPRSLAEAKPGERRVGLVLGAEGSGLRRLQRETCDELVRLPISGAMESLNVAAAAAVALYEIRRA